MSEAARGSPVKGMALGVAVDLGGTFIAGFALLFLWVVWLRATGVDAEGIAQAMTEPDPLSNFAFAGYAVGGACSWLGGYVCARVARETELRCAAVVAAVSTLTGLAMSGGLPWGLAMFLTLLTVGAVMLGGWMGMRRNGAGAS